MRPQVLEELDQLWSMLCQSHVRTVREVCILALDPKPYTLNPKPSINPASTFSHPLKHKPPADEKHLAASPHNIER